MVFRHEFQPKGKSICRFLYVTENSASTLRRLPPYQNLLELEENSVALKRQLRSGSRRQLVDDDMAMCSAPEMMSRKRRQATADEEDNGPEGFGLRASALQPNTLSSLLSLRQSCCVPELAEELAGEEENERHLITTTPTNNNINFEQQGTPVTYWESSETNKLFCPFGTESTLTAIYNQIETMKKAKCSSLG